MRDDRDTDRAPPSDPNTDIPEPPPVEMTTTVDMPTRVDMPDTFLEQHTVLVDPSLVPIRDMVDHVAAEMRRQFEALRADQVKQFETLRADLRREFQTSRDYSGHLAHALSETAHEVQKGTGNMGRAAAGMATLAATLAEHHENTGVSLRRLAAEARGPTGNGASHPPDAE